MHLKYQAWIRKVSTDTSLTQAPQVKQNPSYSNHYGNKLWMSCWTFAAVPQRQQRSSMASKVKTGGGLDVVTDARMHATRMRHCHHMRRTDATKAPCGLPEQSTSTLCCASSDGQSSQQADWPSLAAQQSVDVLNPNEAHS